MKLAAAKAIAGLVPDEELSEDNILPQAFDPCVAETVSRAIKELDLMAPVFHSFSQMGNVIVP